MPESNNLHATCCELAITAGDLCANSNSWWIPPTVGTNQSQPSGTVSDFKIKSIYMWIHRGTAAHSVTPTTWRNVPLTWLFSGHLRRLSAPGAGYSTHQDKTALQRTLWIACADGENIFDLNIGYTCRCGAVAGSPLFHVWQLLPLILKIVCLTHKTLWVIKNHYSKESSK